MGAHTQGREQVMNILPPATKITQRLAETYISGWTGDVPGTSLLSKCIGDRVLKKLSKMYLACQSSENVRNTKILGLA